VKQNKKHFYGKVHGPITGRNSAFVPPVFFTAYKNQAGKMSPVLSTRRLKQPAPNHESEDTLL
jgi:hypothetical protein